MHSHRLLANVNRIIYLYTSSTRQHEMREEKSTAHEKHVITEIPILILQPGISNRIAYLYASNRRVALHIKVPLPETRLNNFLTLPTILLTPI